MPWSWKNTNRTIPADSLSAAAGGSRKCEGMLTILLDRNSVVPLYRQLYDGLRQEIITGGLATGEKLTSKRQLALYLKISENTVAAAYEQLEREGYIESQPRVGFFVAPLADVLPRMPDHPEKSSEELFELETPRRWRYDFLTNTVDPRCFPFPTWAKLSRQVLSEGDEELLKAGDPRGYLPLRQAIAHHVHQYRGVNCTADQVIVGAGSEYLLSLVVQLIGRDATYALENPNYPKVYQVLKASGAALKPILLDDEGLSVDTLKASGATVVHTTPSHQFPLGMVMPLRRRMALLQWANASPGRYIIEDDYDSEFPFEGRPIPALQGLDSWQRVIYFNTFTRSLAPSMRISYMILPAGLLKRYYARFGNYSSTVSLFEQHTLERFMRTGAYEGHLRRMLRIYDGRRRVLLDAVRALPMAEKITVDGEKTGLHLLLRVAGQDEEVLVAKAAQHGIRIYGLSQYYIAPSKDRPRDCVILGYAGMDTAVIPKAVAALGRAWQKL
jgi:GntR family transcriptional regulator/MocR family aminotransferase